MTKLDVLTGIEKLKVCTHYELDGKMLNGSMPGRVDDLGRCKTIYEELPGWTEDISKIKNYEDLPQNAKNYIKFVEDNV